MMMSHRDILRDDMSSSKRENYLLLEPCEVLTEENGYKEDSLHGEMMLGLVM